VRLTKPDEVQKWLRQNGVEVPCTKKEYLLPHADHTVVKDLLTHRQANSALRFLNPTLQHIGSDGRLHPTYNGLGTKTGRITAAKPAVQQIPKRSEDAVHIRRTFVAGPGRVLIAADYSQVELRVIAALSGDGLLVEAFRNGEDPHQRVADECGVSRDAAKEINYGLNYGMRPARLARKLGCTAAEAKAHLGNYFNTMPGLDRYLRHIEERATHYGACWTRYRRRQDIPDAMLPGTGQRYEKALRQARSHVVQGTAADIYKMALVATHGALPAEAHIVLTIHDEIVVEAPEAMATEVAEIIRDCMESAGDLPVPLDVEIGIGATLADTK
jgi:DNA polymerase-1